MSTITSELKTHLLSSSKQGSQTRTSFSMPNFGIVEYFDEHLPQKICPQARQWCWKVRGHKLRPIKTLVFEREKKKMAPYFTESPAYLSCHNTKLDSAPVTLFSIYPVWCLENAQKSSFNHIVLYIACNSPLSIQNLQIRN